MPIYEYECQACGHQFEKLQKISDAPLKDCPVCQKSALSKLISAAGFQLKGNGWYETDFKSKKTTPATSGSSDSKVSTAVKSTAGKNQGNTEKSKPV